MVNIAPAMTAEPTTEERILAAARNVFTQKGMAGARMQEVADEAGINKALLHYYFRSKQQLFEGVFRGEAERQFHCIWCALEDSEELFDAIRNFTEAYLDRMMEDPLLPVFIASELQRDPEGLAHWIDRGNHGREHFLELVTKARKEKRIMAIDPRELLVNMMSLCAHPFIARPLLKHLHGINDENFKRMIKERKRSVPEFIIRSIRS
jgi:AcrR family transcriptional regulator